MKRLALAVLVLVAAGVLADDLTDAAKAAKAKRKKSTTRVITNADVKKAKGNVIERNAPADPVDVPAARESLVDKQERMRKERSQGDAKLDAAKRKVEALEKEAAMLEQKYYDENDLDRRDSEIVKRFDDVKSRLDVAREELAALLVPAPAP
jgi:hypothetical protein